MFLGRAALWLEDPPGGWGILEKLVGRANRPLDQIAPAIGTNAVELFFGASRAESAFIGADARLGAVGCKIAIATFATGSEFEHAGLLRKAEAITRTRARQSLESKVSNAQRMLEPLESSRRAGPP